MSLQTSDTYDNLMARVHRGESLPITWYTDPAIIEPEMRRIFRRTWQYIGPVRELQNVGDYITGMAGNVPVAVVRNADGLAAFVNVCRHRRHQVLKGRGNTRMIQCAYHAWVYDLKGCLRGAPRSEGDPDFRVEDYPLLPIRVEAVGPFVFVNLDQNAKPASSYYGRVLELIAGSGIDLGSLELYSREEWEARANWKTMLENFLECYHCAVAHPGFSAAIDVKPENYVLTHEDWFSSQIGQVRDSALEGKSQVKIYDAGGEIRQAQYHLLWPNFTISMNPGFPNLSVDLWLPNGPNGAKGFSEQYFAPGVTKEFAEELIEFNRQVGHEDDELTDSVQIGLRSGLPEKARFLPNAEYLAIHFQTLVVRALADQEAEAAQPVEDRNTYRPFEIIRVERESDVISSFYLRRADGGPLAPALPGQFLPIRVTIPGQKRPMLRTYTISDVTDGSHYRLSIKREGREASISTFLHDNASPGFRLEAMAPRGKFLLDETSNRPVVLISGGVGLTPVIAMLNHLVAQEGGLKRQVYFIHGTRSGREHAFGKHVRTLAGKHPNLSVHVCYSAPAAADRLEETYDTAGRVSPELIQQLLSVSECDFYLCGPAPFMQSIYDGLIALGVARDRIRYESFGGALTLKPEIHAVGKQMPPVSVRFARSDISADWTPDKGTLLEFAETLGIAPTFGCRSGICGTCATRMKQGSVEYLEEPIATLEEAQVLLCCSIPSAAAKDTGLVFDL
jgi:ferredoxin-NADP reductase/phenylpropionate dioxygenase-like ring-hydroxylating dioxygenase large terminal subunit